MSIAIVEVHKIVAMYLNVMRQNYITRNHVVRSWHLKYTERILSGL